MSLCFHQDLVEGGAQLGVVEMEAGGEKSGGDYSSAFQEELGFGAQDEGADFEHPLFGGEADGFVAGLAAGAHELLVGDGVGGGEIYGAA